MKTGVKYTVETEEMVVSPRGRLSILEYLQGLDLSTTLLETPAWSWDWVRQSGSYRGKLPKRLTRMMKDYCDIILTSEQISEIGNLAKEHVLLPMTYTLDFTDKFDWEAGDFGDFGSCFWTCHALAKEVLHNNSVLAIRLYNESGIGNARAWIYKIAPDTWVLFNAYGVYTRTMANIFAVFLSKETDQSWVYDDIEHLDVVNDPYNLVYINTRPQVVYIEGMDSPGGTSLDWDMEEYVLCYDCEDIIVLEEANPYRGDSYCDSCYEEIVTRCTDCMDRIDDEANEYVYDGDILCYHCWRTRQEEDL